ncbi:hypothetical protein ADJ73_04680 [Arsenicicoccus sp. oral taxon 190]|nr:hypothetical protein ADJ73_04680 [Arsenicicoccus sp. oral taxon 190]
MADGYSLHSTAWSAFSTFHPPSGLGSVSTICLVAAPPVAVEVAVAPGVAGALAVPDAAVDAGAAVALVLVGDAVTVTVLADCAPGDPPPPHAASSAAVSAAIPQRPARM